MQYYNTQKGEEVPSAHAHNAHTSHTVNFVSYLRMALLIALLLPTTKNGALLVAKERRDQECVWVREHAAWPSWSTAAACTLH